MVSVTYSGELLDVGDDGFSHKLRVENKAQLVPQFKRADGTLDGTPNSDYCKYIIESTAPEVASMLLSKRGPADDDKLQVQDFRIPDTEGEIFKAVQDATASVPAGRPRGPEAQLVLGRLRRRLDEERLGRAR